METCCVCGRALPNRYAVAGRCVEEGCGAAFCAMHWHLGARRCPAHGGGREYGARAEEEAPPAGITEGEGTKGEEKMDAGKDGALLERAKTELTPQARTSILKRVAEMAAKVGRGAGALAERVRKARSPEAAVEALDAQLEENRARREPLSKRYEELYAAIAAKRKRYLAAPPARKKLMELELKGMLAEYKALERQLTVLLENERVVATVRGRTMEWIAMGLRKVSEGQIDRLTDHIEEATGEADDVDGALRDLEKAGARREREGDGDAFEAELAGFEEEAPTGTEEVGGAEEEGPAGREAEGGGAAAETEIP